MVKIMDFSAEYKTKLMNPEEAAKLVKPGDIVEYGQVQMTPIKFDAALAKRKNELSDVKLYAGLNMTVPQCMAVDPEQKVFTYWSGFVATPARAFFEDGRAAFIPSHLYDEVFMRESGLISRGAVAAIGVTAMDANGYFNCATAANYFRAMVDHADKVVVEVNTKAPWIFGDPNYSNETQVHISEVYGIIETENQPLAVLPDLPVASENEKKMAQYIMEALHDGCCLQLGIGSLPNAIGTLISQSNLKDLGIHTEVLVDGHMEMYQKGIITGARKNIDKGKLVFAFVQGSQKLYDFVDRNPVCCARSAKYTNDPSIISSLDNMISVNATLQVDLQGQANSEAIGTQQISGTGGALNFTQGATYSKGGKSFLCLNSTRTVKGKQISNIVPLINGIVTIPRSCVHYVVTEYGVALLKGRSVQQRAQALINIAHPDFRDDLARQARELKMLC
jgi:acyl-CoA hydrolase